LTDEPLAQEHRSDPETPDNPTSRPPDTAPQDHTRKPGTPDAETPEQTRPKLNASSPNTQTMPGYPQRPYARQSSPPKKQTKPPAYPFVNLQSQRAEPETYLISVSCRWLPCWRPAGEGVVYGDSPGLARGFSNFLASRIRRPMRTAPPLVAGRARWFTRVAGAGSRGPGRCEHRRRIGVR